MIKILLPILFLLILTLEGRSQADSGSIGALSAYVVPFTWVDRNPRLRLGIEYHAHNQTGYSLEVGFGNNLLNHSRLEKLVWGQEYSFFEIRSEVKWYRKEEKEFNLYWGAELFYQRMSDHLDDLYFYPKESSLTVFYDEADFRKTKIGGLAKAGIKILVWKRVMLDFYEGLGLAYRQNTYSNLVNPIASEDDPVEEWWDDAYKNEGPYFLFQLNVGVRVGYVIGRIDN